MKTRPALNHIIVASTADMVIRQNDSMISGDRPTYPPVIRDFRNTGQLVLGYKLGALVRKFQDA